MTLNGMDVLLVGQSFHGAQALADWLKQRGFRCHFAPQYAKASALLRSRPVGLVLSNTRLPDGSGFGLLMAVAGLPVTAFLCLPVENSCFWLPAIDGGQACLPDRGLAPPSALPEVATRTPRNSAPFTCPDIGQLAGSQRRRRIRNLHGKRDPSERCLCLFDRGNRNLF